MCDASFTGAIDKPYESTFFSLVGGESTLLHTIISDIRYDECFGFTDGDVEEMLRSYGLTSYKEVIREWYDGYRFGEMDVYCPWDVLNYCDELLADPSALPKNYWANTSGNELILHLLKKADQTTKDEMEELLADGTITKEIKQELTYRDIGDSVENVWSVLYSTGYLTGEHVENTSTDVFRLKIPNGEIRNLFCGLVREWFNAMTRADSSRIKRFCMAFLSKDVPEIQKMLQDYLWDSISIRDTAARTNQKEHFYHGMLLGLLQSQGTWSVRSNMENGIGYSDISIRTPERIGIIIELKYAHDGNLENACAAALKQIEDKKYAEGLRRRGMKQLIKYGIAFCEKECMVAIA